MHLTSTAAAPTSPSGPAARRQAADRLTYLPGTALDLAELAAARASASGVRVSRADLVREFHAAWSPALVTASLRDAVDGALFVAPELEPRRAELHAAATGVGELLVAAASDRAPGVAWPVFDALLADLERVAEPLFAAARDLAPELTA